MFLFKFTIVAIVGVVSTQADQTWYNFKTTYAPHLGGRNDQPRTIDEAEQAGWLVVSDDCSEGASFPGARYAPPGDNPEMVLMLQVQGTDFYSKMVLPSMMFMYHH